MNTNITRLKTLWRFFSLHIYFKIPCTNKSSSESKDFSDFRYCLIWWMGTSLTMVFVTIFILLFSSRKPSRRTKTWNCGQCQTPSGYNVATGTWHVAKHPVLLYACPVIGSMCQGEGPVPQVADPRLFLTNVFLLSQNIGGILHMAICYHMLGARQENMHARG